MKLALILVTLYAASAASKTELQTWCSSLGSMATYISQSCFTVTSKTQSYLANMVNGCTEKPFGRLAILSSATILERVRLNVTSQFTATKIHIGLRQNYSSSNGVKDNFYWTDAQGNNYGLNSDMQWYTDEPNDKPTLGENGEEDCGEMGGTSGKIYDGSCNNTLQRALCEYQEPYPFYNPIFNAQTVSSSSSAVITGQTDMSVEQVEHCAIKCRLFGSCRAFVFKKGSLTCTLLFKYDLSDTEIIAQSDATIYGRQ
uniref:C-type lectin domain-containing protein n=1 Tax=Plectus sambesii TaxID=2011161 RepID=A0A914WKH4_9BILA